MISCTDDPNTLLLVRTYAESGTHKRELVCYIRAGENGQVNVFYAYHRDWTRPVPSGPWETPWTYQEGVTPAVETILRGCVMLELMDAFEGLVLRKIPDTHYKAMASKIPFDKLEHA